MNRIFKIAVLTLLLFSFVMCSENTVKPESTPQELYEKMINNPSIKKSPVGESFCWRAAVRMEQYIKNYELTKNKEWLDWGFKYCDFLISNMDEGPDGYKGWIGPYLEERDKKDYWLDSHVGDALLIYSILDFAILVSEDKSLKKIYGEKAKAYTEIAKKDLIEKWDKRNTWHECGPYGAYTYVGKFYVTPDNLKEWKYVDKETNLGRNQPFNKQNKMALTCIRLYKLTGDNFYRDRAEKIFLRMKRTFQYFDDHYVWNYWEPFGLWDIDLEKKNHIHWVGVHPYRSGYTAGEEHQIVDAYHNGIVFDEQDIQRIINTNLKVMWNKSLENPGFINSNGLGGEKEKEGIGSFQKDHGHSNVTKNAGQLWTGLLDFDQTIRDIYMVQIKDNPQRLKRFKKWAKENPPSFKRKHVKGKVSVPEMDFSECSGLNMAVVIPHIIEKGKKSVIISNAMKPGNVEIALYSSDGAKKIKTLYKSPVDGST
ncbi:hypothetical protein KAS50_10015, partial [bacterium]|nr:hypothetical protein [bacterium]